MSLIELHWLILDYAENPEQDKLKLVFIDDLSKSEKPLLSKLVISIFNLDYYQEKFFMFLFLFA